MFLPFRERVSDKGTMLSTRWSLFLGILIVMAAPSQGPERFSAIFVCSPIPDKPFKLLQAKPCESQPRSSRERKALARSRSLS